MAWKRILVLTQQARKPHNAGVILNRGAHRYLLETRQYGENSAGSRYHPFSLGLRQRVGAADQAGKTSIQQVAQR